MRSNTLTRFNAIVGTLAALVLVVGPYQDAVFVVVMVANAVIGIVQEVRSKQALDRLRLLTVPSATVIRQGAHTSVAAHEVVVDDLVCVGRGDQIVVDGELVAGESLEVDESVLTGESRPVPKRVGDRCLSGSAVLAGAGVVRATDVGDASYAGRLTVEARQFRLAASELRAGLDDILRVIAILLLPTGLLVAWAQHRAVSDLGGLVRGAVAATIGMVPQGLVLLTSVAMAVGVVRLARTHVLVQELAAIECLARVDVVCFDKTGTLTGGVLRLSSVEHLEGAESVEPALVSIAAADPAPNATLAAIAAGLEGFEPWPVVGDRVPFRSDRRWSGADFGEHGLWVLGAVATLAPDVPEVVDRAGFHARHARRVLLLARADGGILGGPRVSRPAALVVLADQVKPDVAATLGFFAGQGVDVKILSGDDPATVAAIASQAGVTGRVTDLEGVTDVAGMAEAGSVFGRVSPAQKRSMVAELQRAGHVVAMVGDGVNDLPALKQADIGVAMGAGAGAARAVAQVVLVDGAFERLPRVVAEGRRVIFNIERVAKLYLTKTVYAFMLAMAVATTGVVFPLLPRHVTVIGVLTIGMPSFWLALEPGEGRARPGFVWRVLRFAAPSGALLAVAGFSIFWMARPEATTTEAQTITMLVLIGIGLVVVTVAVRPLSRLDQALLVAMVCGVVLLVAVPGLRSFYAVDLPSAMVVLAGVGVVALAGGLLVAAHRAAERWGHRVVRPMGRWR